MGRYRNLMILRAITKFFGLPGLRLGYIMGDSRVIDGMAGIQPPWSVNGVVSHVAPWLFGQRDFIHKSVSYVDEQRQYLLDSLRGIQYLKVFDTACNFILIKLMHPEIGLERLEQRLLDYTILIRNCSSFAGLGDNFFRVAVKDKRSNDILIGALKDILKGC